MVLAYTYTERIWLGPAIRERGSRTCNGCGRNNMAIQEFEETSDGHENRE
jgi:hypothetical protein